MPNVKNIKELQHSWAYVVAPLPALRLLLPVTLGILAGVNLSFRFEVWLFSSALLFLLLLGGMIYEKLRSNAPFPLCFTAVSYTLFVLFTFAAWSNYRLNYAPRDGLLRFTGKEVVLYGRADGRPSLSAKGASWIMEVERVFDHGRSFRLHDRAKVFLRNPGGEGAAIRYGEMLRVKGTLDLIPPAANRGEFDPRYAARMQQVSVQFYSAGPWQVLHEGDAGLNGFERFIVQPVYNYIVQTLDDLLPPGEERKLSAGVLTGEKELLTEEVFESFKLTGTAHILAVSGLNVGLLALAIHVLLQRLKVTTSGRWLSFLLVTFILVVYSSVTGNSASVKRAAIMSVVMIGGETLGRKTYSVNSLALSDLLILLLDPLDLLNAGFLMTNGAVLAILVIYPRFSASEQKGDAVLRSVGRFFFNTALVTLAAIIGVSPVIAYYFGTFSLVSLLANLPVVLFSTLLMYALVPMLLLNLVSGYAASFFAETSFFFAELTLRSALLFSRFPFASITLKLDATQVWLYYLMLGALLFYGYRQAWGRFAISLLLGLNLLFWYSFFLHPRPTPPDLLTINVGRNLATIFSSGTQTVQIDLGRAPRDQKRIDRQIEAYGFAAPQAVVQFFSPDSLFPPLPAGGRMVHDSSRLVLSSIVIVRPEERVLKLWSRKRSLLMVSGTSRLKEEELYKADIALLWVYRFAPKQQEEVTSWLNYARPKRCILIPASFLPRAHLALMQRYAALHPGVELRSKTRQIAVW